MIRLSLAEQSVSTADSRAARGQAYDLVAQLSHRSQEPTMQTLSQIRQIDSTVTFARNMDAMRHF